METAAYYWGARTLNTVDHPTDTYGMLAYGYREPMKQKAAATGSLRGQYAYYAKRLGEIVAAHPWPAALACSRSLEGNVPEPLSSGSWSPLNRVFYVLVAWGAYKLFREYDEGARDLAGAVRPVLLGTDRDQLLARRKTGFPARAVPIRTIRLCLRAAACACWNIPPKSLGPVRSSQGRKTALALTQTHDSLAGLNETR